VTVRDVASEMGTSNGLIHHYFDSMDDVLAAAFDQAAGSDLLAAQVALSAMPDAPSQLTAFIERYASTESDWTMQLWLDAWAEAGRRAALRGASQRINQAWHALLRDVIVRGVDSGHFTCAEPAAAAWRLLSMLDGMTLQVVAHDSLITRADVVAWATEAAANELHVRRSPRHAAERSA
jgi:AcrR family transcriptional regulator